MTMQDPTTRVPAGDTRASARDTVATGRHEARDRRDDRPGFRETKPFYRTSEFLVYIVAVAAVLIAGYSADDSLDAWRTWLLVAVLSSAYVVSRGLAKAGSRESWRDFDGDGSNRITLD
jgi:hypothetical protein